MVMLYNMPLIIILMHTLHRPVDHSKEIYYGSITMQNLRENTYHRKATVSIKFIYYAQNGFLVKPSF